MKANVCAQYIYDNRFVAQTHKKFIQNPELMFRGTSRDELKLSKEKRSSGKLKNCSFRKKINSQRISPVNPEAMYFRNNFEPTTSVESIHCYIYFVNFYRPNTPNAAEKLIPLNKFLLKDTELGLIDLTRNSMLQINDLLVKTTNCR